MHDLRVPRGHAAPDISEFACAAIPKSVPAVVKRLNDAGTVLVPKLRMGTLAR
jgi:hypothetical protein